MSNDMLRRDCVGIVLNGDTDSVLTVAEKIVTRFTFEDNMIAIRYGSMNTAKVSGIINGQRKKKSRKSARVKLCDVTDYE